MEILDLIFPKKCLTCKKAGKYICPNCLFKVPFTNSICPVCEKFSYFGKTHDKCLLDDSLDGLINIWMYRGVIREAIIKIKYKFAFDIANELSSLTKIELLKYKIPDNTLTIPVPLHTTRKNWRGFNQSELLAKKISKQTGWSIDTDIISKVKVTVPQVKRQRLERYKNEKGSFVVNKKPSQGFERVLIFDDVWTTGSTIREIGKELKRNGYNNVWGLTIARS